MNNDPINTLMAAAANGNQEAKASLLSISSSNSGFLPETRIRAQTALNMLNGVVQTDNAVKEAEIGDTTGENYQAPAVGGVSKRLTNSHGGIPGGAGLIQHNSVQFEEKPSINRSGFMDAWFLGLLTLIVEPIMLFLAYCIFK
jgi:hypothetical protein